MGVGDDIGDMLTSDGLSSTVHVGDMKSFPNSAVVIVPTAGLPDIRTFGGSVVERLRIQVRARSSDYPTVESLMASADAFLNGSKDRTLNGRVYHWIESIQPPFYLGLDDNERPMFSANYSCLRAAST